MILNSLSILKDLERIQYFPQHKIEELQTRKLRDVIKHAYENVQHYRDLFDLAGIKPNDIKDKRDIYKIPITTKKDLQVKAPQELLTYGIKPEDCVIKYTSGSTGQPLKFFLSKNERDFQSLINLRILQSAGFKLTDRTAYIINPHRFPKTKYWFQYLGILRRYYLSVFDTPEIHRDALNYIKPDIIYGYPSNLTLLALLLKGQRNNGGIRPKIVFSSAETLEAKPRAIITSVMDTNVYDILGLVEVGDIAWECSAHKGYHINSDMVLLEFLDKNNKPVYAGQEGRLVCTSLYSYTMPLIRYEVGDICTPSDEVCFCGCTLPLMESIKGRANDFIVLPDGRVIASCFLVILMQSFTDVAQYRVIQEDIHGLTVQVVKGTNFKDHTLRKIKEEIERITNGSLAVEIKILEELSRDESGKIRTVVSNVAPNLQDKTDNQCIETVMRGRL